MNLRHAFAPSDYVHLGRPTFFLTAQYPHKQRYDVEVDWPVKRGQTKVKVHPEIKGELRALKI
jgi:hypothetical protein